MAGQGNQKAQGSPAVPPAWRAFLRGLALELEAQAGSDASAAILRAAGQQMAAMLALLAVHSLEALELEMNSVPGRDWLGQRPIGAPSKLNAA